MYILGHLNFLYVKKFRTSNKNNDDSVWVREWSTHKIHTIMFILTAELSERQNCLTIAYTLRVRGVRSQMYVTTLVT